MRLVYSLALCPKGNEAAKQVPDLGEGIGCWAIEHEWSAPNTMKDTGLVND